jgi:hypothetical protein
VSFLPEEALVNFCCNELGGCVWSAGQGRLEGFSSSTRWEVSRLREAQAAGGGAVYFVQSLWEKICDAFSTENKAGITAFGWIFCDALCSNLLARESQLLANLRLGIAQPCCIFAKKTGCKCCSCSEEDRMQLLCLLINSTMQMWHLIKTQNAGVTVADPLQNHTRWPRGADPCNASVSKSFLL